MPTYKTLTVGFFLKLDKMAIMLPLLFQTNVDIQRPLVWDLTQFKFYIERVIYVQWHALLNCWRKKKKTSFAPSPWKLQSQEMKMQTSGILIYLKNPSFWVLHINKVLWHYLMVIKHWVKKPQG